MSRSDTQVRLENIQLHTKLKENKQKSKEYIKYAKLYKKMYDELRNENEKLKLENKLIKNKYDKIPKLIRRIFIRSEI